MDREALLAKLQSIQKLAERGVDGEQENAEALLAKLMEKYNISEDELSESTRKRYVFEFHGKDQKKILLQIIFKVTGECGYELKYTQSGRKVKTHLGAECTPSEKVEIEFLADFYTALWERERDAFLKAFIHKHKIYSLREDAPKREMSDEEAEKLYALMRGMSDESPHRAIGDGK